jgi:hypothetical protein
MIGKALDRLNRLLRGGVILLISDAVMPRMGVPEVAEGSMASMVREVLDQRNG